MFREMNTLKKFSVETHKGYGIILLHFYKSIRVNKLKLVLVVVYCCMLCPILSLKQIRRSYKSILRVVYNLGGPASKPGSKSGIKSWQSYLVHLA